jgi:4-hydroxy-3-methylbut-2-en-1-yl diphosphate synthase IspG/GcpE
MESITCTRCEELLVPKKTVFNYMGRSFTHDVPCCPKCGRVFITQELAEGKMAEVEEQLEDK